MQMQIEANKAPGIANILNEVLKVGKDSLLSYLKFLPCNLVIFYSQSKMSIYSLINHAINYLLFP